MLTDIELFLPKLTNLYFYPLLCVSPSTPNILSRLSSLQTIDIIVDNKHIGQQIGAKLLEKCPKIRDIRITDNGSDDSNDSNSGNTFYSTLFLFYP